MKDVFALRKPSRALQLCIKIARIVLSIAEEDLKDDAFRALVLDQPEKVLSIARSIGTQRISEYTHEQICSVMEDAEYDPATAARESESGLFLDLNTMLLELRRQLEAEHHENRRLLPTASFVVGVDGSRQSYMAFEVATRLCRQGNLTVVHVNEEQRASQQLPVVSSDFILEEYKSHCNRFKLPANRIRIESAPNSSSVGNSTDSSVDSVADQLMRSANGSNHSSSSSRARGEADFLMLGAVGKGGPAVDQVGHVPREILRVMTTTNSSRPRILIVPPAPVNAMRYKQYVFVVAVDRSPIGVQCLSAAFKLMRPTDIVRVVHFYKKPIVGEYDEQPFAYYKEILASFSNAMLMSNAAGGGVVDILPVAMGTTIAESVQDYVANQNASYLVIGKTGEQHASTKSDSIVRTEKPSGGSGDDPSEALGRVASALLFSPRCAICICV